MSFRLIRRLELAAAAALMITGWVAAGSPAVAAKPKCFGERATIVAKKGQKVVNGTKKSDVIAGTNGNQTIRGKGGRDRICGFGGKDKIRGQRGADLVDGGGGNDNVNGGDGSQDLVAGNTGDDRITGGRGDLDFLFGLEGDDAINGGGGRFDTASFEQAESAVTVNLTTGTATGEGNDTLTAIGDILGSQFNDSLAGNDTADGNGFYGLGGDDTIDGGGGPLDVVFFPDVPGPLTIDLAAGTATGDGTDTLVDIEDAHGSPGDDVMTGSAAPNFLIGLEGSDQILGLAGDDLLDGDAADPLAGSDTLDGGDGNDICLNAETLVSCESTTPPSARRRSGVSHLRGHVRR